MYKFIFIETKMKKEKVIKVQSQPRWIARSMFAVWAILWLGLALHMLPVGWSKADNQTTPASNYVYEAVLSGENTLTICDPNDSSACITMMDRNLWATSNDITSTWSYWYHFQWWNNHWFEIWCWESWCVDTVAENATWTLAEWNDSYENSWYYWTNFITGGNDYRSGDSHYNSLRGWSWDSEGNNRWYDTGNHVALNVADRKWPCDTWYHVPSIWEWNTLIEYWATGNGVELEETLEWWKYSTWINTLQFKNDFKMPFAGSRGVDALLHWVEDYTTLYSSTPNGSFASNFYLTSGNGIGIEWEQSRVYALSIRCFKDEAATFPKITFYDWETPIWIQGVLSWTMLSSGIIDQVSTKTGYTFVSWWYLSGATEIFDFENTPITGDLDLYATREINTYEIKFVDWSWENANVVWTWEYGTGTSWVVTYPSWTKAWYTLSWDKEIPATVPAEDTVITAIWTIIPTVTYWWGGWVRLVKDKCPNGDLSDSYYDKTCEPSKWSTKTSTKTTTKEKEKTTTSTKSSQQEVMANWFTREMNEAYKFAYENGITTRKNISSANMKWWLTRIAMAKMLSQYAINVLWIVPDPDDFRNCNFPDVTKAMDVAYDNWVTLACQLWIMWVWTKTFRPNEPVTRAHFWTALSRLLFNTKDGRVNYYSTHLAKLKEEWIISNDSPTLKETRWNVMLMLMRSAEWYEDE